MLLLLYDYNKCKTIKSFIYHLFIYHTYYITVFIKNVKNGNEKKNLVFYEMFCY